MFLKVINHAKCMYSIQLWVEKKALKNYSRRRLKNTILKTEKMSWSMKLRCHAPLAWSSDVIPYKFAEGWVPNKFCHGNYYIFLPWNILQNFDMAEAHCNSVPWQLFVANSAMATTIQFCHGNYSRNLPWQQLIANLPQQNSS